MMSTEEQSDRYKCHDVNSSHDSNENDIINKKKDVYSSIESETKNKIEEILIPPIASKEFYHMKHKYRDDIMNITFYLLYDIEIDVPRDIKYYFSHYAQSCIYLLHTNSDASSIIHSNDVYEYIANHVKSSMNTPTNSLMSSNDDLNTIHTDSRTNSSLNSSRSCSDESKKPFIPLEFVKSEYNFSNASSILSSSDESGNNTSNYTSDNSDTD